MNGSAKTASVFVATFVEGPSVGYFTDTRHSGLAQRQYRLFNGGRVLTERGTEAVFRSVLPKLHCGE